MVWPLKNKGLELSYLLEAEEPDSVRIVVRMLLDRGRGTVRQDRLSFDVWRLKPAFDIRRLWIRVRLEIANQSSEIACRIV